jgi:hypothetical protein
MAPRRLSFEQRHNEFQQSLAEARSRSDADEALAQMLADSAIEHYQRVEVAHSLFRTRGPAGTSALRREFSATLERSASTTNKRNRAIEYDLIGACAGALMAREGDKAMDVFMAVFEYPNASLSEYGMGLLESAGDDTAWEKVITRLADLLRRPMNLHGMRWFTAGRAIGYLAKHSPPGSERAIQLTTLVRTNWRRIPDPSLLEGQWPGIEPGGPAPESITFPRPPLPPRRVQPPPADPDLEARLARLSRDSDIAPTIDD